MKTIQNLDLNGKRVLLRADLNVPAENGKILDDSRIVRLMPSIKLLKTMGAKIILASHFGRPKGKIDPKFSLSFLREYLMEKYETEVTFVDDLNKAENASIQLDAGEILLLENLRFHDGEERNSKEFAEKLSKAGDIYVNDAFACSHRAHASIDAITDILPSYPGLLLEEETSNLENAIENAKKPNIAIVGGKKVSTKFPILYNLSRKVDYLVIGGAMANTFLLAQGHDIASSYHEAEIVDQVKDFISNCGCKLILPKDICVAQISNGQFIRERTCNLDDIHQNEAILDLGPESSNNIQEVLNDARTIMWNGPLGMFEDERFAVSTNKVAKAIVDHTKSGKMLSIAGGGDIVSALNKNGCASGFSYISTAGGAFLEWLEGKDLPGITALKKDYKSKS